MEREKYEELSRYLPGLTPECSGAYEWLAEIFKYQVFELKDFCVPYMMNDAAEAYLVFEDCRMTGEMLPDYEGEVTGRLENGNNGDRMLLAPDSVKLKEKLSEPPQLSVNGTELSAQACLSEAFNLYGVNGEGYTAVVDDELAAELPQYRTCLVMNTQERLPADTEELSELAYGADYENYDPETDTYTLNSSIEDAMDSNVIIFAFALFYVGLIFACIAASILAVQQLSDSVRYQYRYEVLSKLGMNAGQIGRLVGRQTLLYFALPLILPIPASILLTLGMKRLLLDALVAPELFVWSAALSVGIFLLIYVLYVLAAYLGYKRKVMEHIE